MKKRHLSRRTILKGLGSVAIGLPLLEEMLRPTTASPPSLRKMRREIMSPPLSASLEGGLAI